MYPLSLLVVGGFCGLILTGYSPQGVGMGRKPALWLKDGDQVEVSLEGVGSISNKVVFDKPNPKL